MRELTEFESRVADLIVQSLNLEVGGGDIDPQAPLFGEGLGLDSIDALELSIEVSRQFGCQLRSDDPDNVRIFASLESLAAYVDRHRTR